MARAHNPTRRKTEHGGTRPGAGRPVGTGKFGGSESKVMRIPVHLETAIRALIHGDQQGPRGQHLLSKLSVRSTPGLPTAEIRVPAGAFDYHGESATAEYIDLNAWLAREREQAYVYTVSGDSMNRAGLLDGDRLVVDRSLQAVSGSIVVAWVSGEGLTVKRLNVRGGRVALEPESDNPRHRAYTVGADDEVTVLGVVSGIARRLR